MGIGIIALGLWLLFGIKISINDINIIPPMIAYTFIIWGTTIVLKNYKNKKIMISYVLSYVLLLLEIPDYFITTLISIILSYIHLYLLLNGILEIAYDYPDINYMEHKFKNYLIIFLIINIATFIIYIFEITNVTFTPLLIVIYAIMTIPMVYRLSKINNYLYSQNEPIKIDKPIPRNHKNTFLALLTIIISILFIIIGNSIIPKMNKVKEINEFVVLSGESKNIKVEYAAIHYHLYQNNIFTIESDLDTLSPQFYMKNELFQNIETIDYQVNINNDSHTKTSLKPIVNNDKDIIHYKNYQNFKFQENEDDLYFSYENIFEGFNIDSQLIQNMKNESIENYIIFTITDKNHNQTEEIVKLHPIHIKEFGYKDNNIKIDSVLTDGNVLLCNPNIYIQKTYFPQNIDYNRIIIELNNMYSFGKDINKYQEYIDNSNTIMYQMIENNDFKITIKLYNNNILVDTQTYQLEELQ